MRLIEKYNQFRRDCWCDLECENCGEKATNKHAYDDRNYWDNVIPTQKCEKCGKSTKDLGLQPEKIATKYSDYETV